ncbi:hypothetical protein ACTFIV_005134, partial [Dictyostelium citrinum]
CNCSRSTKCICKY